MIKVAKEIRKEQGLYLIVTEIDAAAANITTDCQRECVDGNIMNHLEDISKEVDSDTRIKKFKDYLIEKVFSHYVDMIAVLDYIYVVRKLIRAAKEFPNHSKFIFITSFENYVPAGTTNPKCDGGECEDGGGDKDGSEDQPNE